jgi:hypothetical protein
LSWAICWRSVSTCWRAADLSIWALSSADTASACSAFCTLEIRSEVSAIAGLKLASTDASLLGANANVRTALASVRPIHSIASSVRERICCAVWSDTCCVTEER